MADPVEDKARRNFCEYFQLDKSPLAANAGGAASQGREAAARARLEQMFGGKGSAAAASCEPTPGGDRAADARKKLDQLFGNKPKTDGT